MTTDKVTPSMDQYLKIKAEYPDCLLFYRVGDFYELFFADAFTASKALDIVLTYRGKHLGQPIPLCGVPFHAYENYLVRLVKAGYKVAICEQMETPEEAKKRGSKTLVRREVIRIVTAGTLTDENLLNARHHNYLVAIAESGVGFGVAWADMSTGDFYIQNASIETLPSVMARLEASEVLVQEDFTSRFPHLWDNSYGQLTERPASDFSPLLYTEIIQKYSNFSKTENIAIGVIHRYLTETQKGEAPLLSEPQQVNEVQLMQIDGATRRSLELTTALSTERGAKSLLSVLDETVTGAGARLLSTWLSSPLMDLDLINARLDQVNFFKDNPLTLTDIRTILKEVPDIERCLTRLAVGRGGPRDMVAIANGLGLIPTLRTHLVGDYMPNALCQTRDLMGEHSVLVDEIKRAILNDIKEIPLLARDGGFIQSGYNAQLDEYRSTRGNAKKMVADLQAKYVAQTNIQNLKVTFNNLLGYFVEVPTRFSDPLLTKKEMGFIHRQTMVNCVRFTTIELSELEDKIRNAESKALSLELELYEALRQKVIAASTEILQAARALACLDVVSGLAHLAIQKNWVRPTLTLEKEFDIKGGRHPVVEDALSKIHTDFIPNDCNLNEQNNLWLLTGPNMAGKSTFLRQNALIAVLGQMGSYVPAESATIGLVDKLFSRVGASDDLARGRSTFMIEMVEVATILNNATDRSLVILDEVGRGTATFDGLSIAWATVEYLHDHNRARALFATHYHELTALGKKLPRVSMHTMRIKEWQGDVVFLHEVGEGIANCSYGVHVARLAGMPESVLTRAEQVLNQLEEKKAHQKPLFDDLPLFSAVEKEVQAKESVVEKELKALDVDALSPREALDVLYRLKGEVK